MFLSSQQGVLSVALFLEAICPTEVCRKSHLAETIITSADSTDIALDFLNNRLSYFFTSGFAYIRTISIFATNVLKQMFLKDRSRFMVIETERLIITEFTMDMARIVQANSVDEDNRRFVPDEVWDTVEEAEETLKFLISRYESSEGPFVYPVIVKETKENIGYVQLCPMDDGHWEAGYHIAEKYTGKGYATEAVKAFLPVISKKAGTSEIYGICLEENKASLAVLIKCGFETIFRGIGKYQGADREIVKNIWRAGS